MNKISWYILACSVAGVIIIVLSSALAISKSRNNERACEGLRVSVTDSMSSRFVSAGEIRKYVEQSFGTVQGTAMSDIDLKGIEETINSKSAVRKCEAYLTHDGYLNLEVVQRKPLVRFQGKNGGFYSDREGYLFPLKSDYAPHVMVVDGNLPLSVGAGYKGEGANAKERKWISDIIALVEYMGRTGSWHENIAQIHVNGNGDLVLVPRAGKEKFIFGKPEKMEKKFSMMEEYYRRIVPAKGENYYSSVNLKFDGQIICKK